MIEARSGRSVEFTSSVARTLTAVGGGVDLTPILEQPFWNVRVTLPDTEGKAARIMVREFQRYFTDQTLFVRLQPMRSPRRRIVEERLVYAATFDL